MASSPDAAHATFKNFAMSQSPPSYSPMRRREAADTQAEEFSQSSPESGADEPVTATEGTEQEPSQSEPQPVVETAMDESDEEEEEQTAPPAAPAAMDESEEDEEEAAPPAPAAMDESEEDEEEAPPPAPAATTQSDEDEEDASQEEAQAPLGEASADSAPADGATGVAVLQNANASSGEEEDDAMDTEVPPPPPAQAAEADEDEESEAEQQQPEQVAAEQAEASEDQSEAEEAKEQQPQQMAVEQAAAASEADEASEEAEEAQEPQQAEVKPEEESDEDEAMAPAEALAPVEALVAVDAAPNLPPVIAPPRSPNRETWGALPEDAAKPWSVNGETCSLEVGGQVLKLPRAVYDRLFAYQRQGVAWLWNLHQKGFGGILADDMGLGKTVQVAAFLACLKCSNEGSRFLVVVPPTLLEQWRREIKSWAAESGLAVHVMHGSQQERRAALRGMVARQGVLLTTYDLVRNCIDHIKQASLSKASALLPKKRKKQTKRGCRDDDSPSEAEEEVPAAGPEDDADRPWDAVIVDEGHQIKNPSCLAGRALRKLEAKSRFLLTGTPLQNKLGDLWALMDFCQPGLLGNHATFERNFSDQIAKGSQRNATRFAVELKDHLARELRRLTAPHFLRRLKEEVLTADGTPLGDGPAPEELPSKTDCVLWLNLTNAQLELYNTFLQGESVQRATEGRNGMEALRSISVLKKITNHPLLCLPKEEFAEWRQRTVPSSAGKVPGGPSSSQAPAEAAPAAPAVDMDDYDDGADMTQAAPESHDFLARLRALVPGSAEGAALLSCKLRVLSVLLPQLQKRGHRCLLFSHSTRMLDLIQACVLRVLGLKFLRIDGTIEAKDRDLKLTKFQAPDSRYFCMCLSAQVGGVGLTITGADRVILCDPAWNPAMDAQAIDRVHRIGQKKDVVVYRLIGSGAIEDKMFRLQVFKRSLAKTAMEQESQIRFFSKSDLKQLFEAPNQSTSTQSLMAEQLGTEALEHEDLLSVVAGDIGSTDDPDAMPFWQSSDVLGFSDYSRLFMYLEQIQKGEEEAESCAKEMTDKLRSEEYRKGQVVEGKFARTWKETKENTENENPQVQDAAPLADA